MFQKIQKMFTLFQKLFRTYDFFRSPSPELQRKGAVARRSRRAASVDSSGKLRALKAPSRRTGPLFMFHFFFFVLIFVPSTFSVSIFFLLFFQKKSQFFSKIAFLFFWFFLEYVYVSKQCSSCIIKMFIIY